MRHLLVNAFSKVILMTACNCSYIIRSVYVSCPPFVPIPRRSLLLCLYKFVVTGDPVDEKTVVLYYLNLYQYLQIVCKFLFVTSNYKHSSFKSINCCYYRLVLSI